MLNETHSKQELNGYLCFEYLGQHLKDCIMNVLCSSSLNEQGRGASPFNEHCSDAAFAPTHLTLLTVTQTESERATQEIAKVGVSLFYFTAAVSAEL
jgi:hypothetical protein